MKRYIGLIALLLIANGSISYGASFDCVKASIKVERMICNNRQISDLDERLTRTYEERLQDLKNSKPLREQQRVWLHQVRNRCHDVRCLKVVYEKRLSQLSEAPTFPSDYCDVIDGETLGEGYCLASMVEANEQLLSSLIDVLIVARGLTKVQVIGLEKRQTAWRNDLRCHCEAKGFGYNTGRGNVIHNCELPQIQNRVGEINEILNGAAWDYGGYSPRTCQSIKEALEAESEYQFVNAVQRNDINRVTDLLSGTVIIGTLDIYYYGDPVFYAAKNNNVQMLRLLLQHGAISTGTSRGNPIDAALEHCNNEMVAILVESGASDSGIESLWSKKCSGSID